MYKLNKTEILVLDLIDDKWKYIVREKDGGLSLFTEKPVKNENNWYCESPKDPKPWTTLEALKLDELLFDFISWFDEYPTDLDEIREQAGKRYCKNCDARVIPQTWLHIQICPHCGHEVEYLPRVGKNF